MINHGRSIREDTEEDIKDNMDYSEESELPVIPGSEYIKPEENID